MRVGVLCRGEAAQFDWARQLGFRSVEWVRFHESPTATKSDWKPLAEEVAAAARDRDLRISAIGALYNNPLDPAQSDYAGAVFRHAIEVAAHLGIKTVSGFPGAVIETTVNPRGGNPVYKPFEDFLPQLLDFWEPIARLAADRGVRIAFEHCPQGAWHLPVMGYNMLAQPAMWERLFNSPRSANLGLEWDASHLICQFIDPLDNIRKFGGRIFHVHAKDAFINQPLLARYGICHPGVAEHRFVGLGQSSWPQIVHELLRAGYDSDLNIEGHHDPVFRDHTEPLPDDLKTYSAPRLKRRRLENAGLAIARDTLAPLVAGTE